MASVLTVAGMLGSYQGALSAQAQQQGYEAAAIAQQNAQIEAMSRQARLDAMNTWIWGDKRPVTFPRTISQRIRRMDEFVEWKRDKIRERNTIRVLTWLSIAVGTPIAIAIIAYAWRFGVRAVLG